MILLSVSKSTAEKWHAGAKKASGYHANAIELQDYQFQSLLLAEKYLEKLKNSIPPAKLALYENWREAQRQEEELNLFPGKE